MEIPGLGSVSEDSFGWYRSAPLPVPVLGNATCHILLDGYDDPEKEDFHAAITTFLTLDESVLKAAATSIFDYYQDVKSDLGGSERLVAIASPDDVWEHIHIGTEVVFQRDSHRGRRVYVSVECECDWEPEYGLQIVFRDGRTVTKLGPYDGHLTNAAAYARDDLEKSSTTGPGRRPSPRGRRRLRHRVEPCSIGFATLVRGHAKRVWLAGHGSGRRRKPLQSPLQAMA